VLTHINSAVIDRFVHTTKVRSAAISAISVPIQR